MPLQIAPLPVHLPGEPRLPTPRFLPPLPDALRLTTCGGRVRGEWDAPAPVTPLGQWVFFAQFLHTRGCFERWGADCPWVSGSPNAPLVRPVLGPVLLSGLSGHHRYAHVSALRNDLRHTYACRVIAKGERTKRRAAGRIAVLSRSLGHARVTDTDWSLRACLKTRFGVPRLRGLGRICPPNCVNAELQTQGLASKRLFKPALRATPELLAAAARHFKTPRHEDF